MTDYMKEAERLIECLRCSMTAGSWDEYRAALLAHIQRGAVLDKPARVGNGIFGAGLPTRYVIEAAQRLYEAEAERGPRTLDQIHEDERVRRKTWEMFNGPLTGSEDIQRGGVAEGYDGKRVLREVFALCEDTEAKCSEEPGDFSRGRRFEAKGIARAIGAWYQEEFCGRTHMGEPAAPAPDPFCDAAVEKAWGRFEAELQRGQVKGAAPAEVALQRGLARDNDALDEARAERACSMGVGCGTSGACYAAANGQPELCQREQITAPAPAEVPMPEPVAYGIGNTAITGHTNRLMMVRIVVPLGDQYAGAGWHPLVLANEARAYGDAREAAGHAREARMRALLQSADLLFAPHCHDCTARNWLDDTRAALAEGAQG